ncbi:MAG: hypothetical protein HPY83_00655 [Anaerolineae bacterium]|nr:hypothetical protein [Anaerolineae bacterium]
MHRQRLLQASMAAMGLGLLFLLSACGLLAWRYAVGPVPRLLAYAVIGTGLVAGTAILAGILLYGLLERQGKPGD